MLHLNLPGKMDRTFSHLVIDFNGTIAIDGVLKPALLPLLEQLNDQLDIHILTADTHGTVKSEIEAKIPALSQRIHIIPADGQRKAKRDFVLDLVADETIAVGNGCNDCLMLQEAGLSLCVMDAEGASVKTLLQAEMVFRSAEEAFSFLYSPGRMKAGLRI